MSFRKSIFRLHRGKGKRKGPPHAKHMGRAGKLAVPPNFGANTPSKARNGASPSAPTPFQIRPSAPQAEKPRVRAGAGDVQRRRSKENFAGRPHRRACSRRRTLSACGADRLLFFFIAFSAILAQPAAFFKCFFRPCFPAVDETRGVPRKLTKLEVELPPGLCYNDENSDSE